MRPAADATDHDRSRPITTDHDRSRPMTPQRDLAARSRREIPTLHHAPLADLRRSASRGGFSRSGRQDSRTLEPWFRLSQSSPPDTPPEVRSWLHELWPSRPAAPAAESDGDATPPWAAALEQQLTKVSRAQAKLSVRLDDIVTRLDTLVDHAHAPPGDVLDPAPLLDVLDRLDEAHHILIDDRPAVARGLAALVTRLEAVLDSLGVQRVTVCGVQVDPTLFRVIGVEHGVAVRDGEVTRVVRAAARRGARVIREGEVLVGRNKETGEP